MTKKQVRTVKKKAKDAIDKWINEHQRKMKTDKAYRKSVEDAAKQAEASLNKELERKKAEDTLFEDIKAKLVPNTGPSNGAEILAKLIELYDCEDEGLNPADLSIQWTANTYIARKVLRALPLINKLYSGLKKLNVTEKNAIRFNDDDDAIWRIPHPKDRIFAYRTDSPLYLLFVAETLEGYPNTVTHYHCRQFWEPYSAKDETYDVAEIKKNPIEWAIRHADDLVERYSDNIAGNPYVDRPDLKWYTEHLKLDNDDDKYAIRYRDFRDPGYVFTIRAPSPGDSSKWDAIRRPEVDGALTNIAIIRRALFALETSEVALDEKLKRKNK